MFGSKHVRKTCIYTVHHTYTRGFPLPRRTCSCFLSQLQKRSHKSAEFLDDSGLEGQVTLPGAGYGEPRSEVWNPAVWDEYHPCGQIYFCKTSWLADMQGHTHFFVTTSAAWQGGEVRLQASRQDSKNVRSSPPSFLAAVLGQLRACGLVTLQARGKSTLASTPALPWPFAAAVGLLFVLQRVVSEMLFGTWWVYTACFRQFGVVIFLT